MSAYPHQVPPSNQIVPPPTPFHEHETEAELYGEWFKLRAEYHHDPDDIVLRRVELYRTEERGYTPDGRHNPHTARLAVEITSVLTESQRLDIERSIRDELANLE